MIQPASHFDVNAKFLGKLSGDVQAEASSPGFARTVIFAAIEFFVDVGLIGLANPNTGVLHLKLDRITNLLCAHYNFTRFSVFDRVRHEVLQQLFQVEPAGHHWAKFWRQVQVEV